MNGDLHFLSPCILPITGLGFQQSNLGQNKKTNLSDNVNVSLLPPLNYIALSQILVSDTRVERLTLH